MKHFFLIAVLSILFSFGAALAAQAAVTIDPDLYPGGAATISGERPGPADAVVNEPGDGTRNAADGYRRYITSRIVSVLLGIAGVIAVYFIVLNGFWLAASGGSEEVVTQHKKGLMWAVVGLLLVILSYSILRFIISVPFAADERLIAPPPQPGEQQGE